MSRRAILPILAEWLFWFICVNIHSFFMHNNDGCVVVLCNICIYML